MVQNVAKNINTAKKFVLATSLSVLHNYFDNLTKLFSVSG